MKKTKVKGRGEGRKQTKFQDFEPNSTKRIGKKIEGKRSYQKRIWNIQGEAVTSWKTLHADSFQIVFWQVTKTYIL